MGRVEVLKARDGFCCIIMVSKEALGPSLYHLIKKQVIDMFLKRIHHVAVIVSDYERSKDFYVRVLGLTPMGEVYREERDSYKLDLAVNGEYQIELFSFPDPAGRPNYPEAAGLRHLAFEVDIVEDAVTHLETNGVEVEPVRVDPVTGKKYTFFKDLDGLPIEIYEG